MNRAYKIKACRPHITIKESKNTSDEEQFQNQVIRPILKFQNELFIILNVLHCMEEMKNVVFYRCSTACSVKVQSQNNLLHLFFKKTVKSLPPSSNFATLIILIIV